MSRKSTKQARFDSLSQREQNKERKRKLNTKRKDANRWGNNILNKLAALKEAETDE